MTCELQTTHGSGHASHVGIAEHYPLRFHCPVLSMSELANQGRASQEAEHLAADSDKCQAPECSPDMLHRRAG